MVLWKIIKVKSPLLGTSKRENTFDGKVTPLRICQGLLENIKWWVQGCSWQEHHNEVDQKPRSCSWLSSCRAAMGLFLRDYEAAAGRAEIRWWWNQPRWHKLYTKNHFLNQHHLFVKFCFWNNYGLKGNCRDNREGPCVLFGCHGWLHLLYLQSYIKPSKATDAVWVSISMLFFVTYVDSCTITATEV